MKLDFDEVEKGLNESLEKSASNAERFLERNKSTPNISPASAPPVQISPSIQPPQTPRAETYTIPGEAGTLPWWLPKSNKEVMYKNKLDPSSLTADMPFSEYMWKDTYDPARSQTLIGDLAAPLLVAGQTGINAAKWGLGRTFPSLRLPGQAIDTVSSAAKALTGGAPTTPTAPSKGIGQTMSEGLTKGKDFFDALGAAPDKAEFLLKRFPGSLGKLKQTWDNMGAAGHIATPLIGLGITAILAHYFNKQNQTRYPMAGGQPININIGGKPVHPMFENSGVGTFNKYSEDHTKEANLVVDSLTNAVKNRIANKVIDDVVTPEEKYKQQQKEKELEITSRYPEMAKLLEDDKNRLYLERLLKE
jgi:hypothetical protein